MGRIIIASFFKRYEMYMEDSWTVLDLKIALYHLIKIPSDCCKLVYLNTVLYDNGKKLAEILDNIRMESSTAGEKNIIIYLQQVPKIEYQIRVLESLTGEFEELNYEGSDLVDDLYSAVEKRFGNWKKNSFQLVHLNKVLNRGMLFQKTNLYMNELNEVLIVSSSLTARIEIRVEQEIFKTFDKIPKNQTIRNIKERIAQVDPDFKVENQELFLGANILDDDNTLEYYGDNISAEPIKLFRKT